MQKLFFLIKQMNSTEKKYIVQRLSINKEGKNNYLKLYKAIEKQKEYDEEYLIKKFRNEPFVKQLAVVKTRLYSLILHYLGSYHHQDLNFRVIETIQNAGILFEKGMYQSCLEELNNTQIQAEKLENYEQVLYIIQQKIKVSMQLNIHPKEVLLLIEDKNVCLKKIEAFNIMQMLGINLFTNLRNTSRAEALKNEQVLNVINTSKKVYKKHQKYKSYIIDSWYYEILAYYHAYIGNSRLSLEYRKLKLIAMESKSPEFLEINQSAYISLLGNGNITYLGITNISEKEYTEWSNKLLQVYAQCNVNSLKARIYCHLAIFQLSYFIKQKKIENLKLLLTQLSNNNLLNNYLKLSNNMILELLISIYQALAYSLIEKNPSQPVLLLENLFDQYGHKLTHGQIYILRLIIIIIYFDTQTYEIIPSLVISLKRFLVKSNLKNQYNFLFLNMLAQASIKANLNKQKMIFKNFIDKKNILQAQNPSLKISTLYNFEEWIAEKIE